MSGPSSGWRSLAVILTCQLCLACPADDRRAFSPLPYLADLAQLESFTAGTYANFEWALSEGGLDPVAVHGEARRAILAATRDEEAARALHGFVDAFGDGHFLLRPEGVGQGGPDGGGPAGPGPETPAAEACSRLGYEEHDHSFRLDFGDGLRPVTPSEDPVPAGWLGTGGARVGIIRIDEFGANRFGEYCPQTWEAYRRQLDGACDDWPCEYGFRLAIVDRLLDEIAGRITALEEHGITALVVDITGNGGGSDWIHPTAGMLTETPLAGNGRSVVRHPHWRGIFGEMAADVDRDLARNDLSLEQRRLLEEVRARLEAGMVEAAEACDLSSVWEEGPGELPCTLLVRDKLFTTGLLAAPPPIDTEGLSARSSLYKALDYGQRAIAWRGPLAVLTDHDTASASELFAALLRDNDAATLIGERTHGTGCGYSNGGIQTVLEHSRLEVWLPDCVRHRRGGGSERAGITADLPIEWIRGQTAREKGARFLAQIERWVGAL